MINYLHDTLPRHVITPTRFVCHAYGPLERYVKLWVANALERAGTFFPQPRVNDPDMHHGTCVTLVPRYMLGSLDLAVSFDSMAGRRPGIPGTWATHSFTCLVRGPWGIQHNPMYTSTPSRGALSYLVMGCFNHPFKSITLFGHLGLAEIFLITHFVIFIYVSFIRNFMGCDIFSISWLKMKLSKTWINHYVPYNHFKCIFIDALAHTLTPTPIPPIKNTNVFS